MKRFLVADIGATHTRIAVVNDKYEYLKRSHYKNEEITSITDAIRTTIRGFRVNAACLAVAGPPNADRSRIHMTNYPWEIDAQEIAKLIRAKVILLNDFEALGFSIDFLKNENYVELTNKGLDLTGTVALIGAGTGLGYSILTKYGDRHYPIFSEGGRVSVFFNPESKLEMDLYKYMRQKKVVMEAESLLSGRGIELLYDFLSKKKLKHDKKAAREIKETHDRPAAITKYALQDRDPLCIKVVELFVLFYSRAARDLAITTLSTTLVIGGGIAPRILPIMKDAFLEAFVSHDHIEARKFLEEMTVLVLTDPEITLFGCYRALKA